MTTGRAVTVTVTAAVMASRSLPDLIEDRATDKVSQQTEQLRNKTLDKAVTAIKSTILFLCIHSMLYSFLSALNIFSAQNVLSDCSLLPYRLSHQG
jgi:hypothetical protein